MRFLAIMLTFGLATAANGQCRQVIVHQNQAIVVTTPVVTPLFVSQLLTYDPRIIGGNYYPQVCQPNEDLISRIKNLESALQKLQTNSLPPAVPGKFGATNYADVLRRNCVSCHNPTNAKGHVVMTDLNGNILPNLDLEKIWSAVSEGRMPPLGRPRVSDTDLTILRRK